jgi:hypothetical protein
LKYLDALMTYSLLTLLALVPDEKNNITHYLFKHSVGLFRTVYYTTVIFETFKETFNDELGGQITVNNHDGSN